MSDDKKQGKVLTDHFQKKKKFITPYNHHFNIQETFWIKEAIPELIWLSELNHKLGIKQASEVAREFAIIVKNTINTKSFLGFLSNYFEIEKKDIDKIILQSEKKNIRNALAFGLRDLNNFYPKNPLKFIAGEDISKSDLCSFKKRLNKLYEKHCKESIFMIANAHYIAFTTDLLVVQSDMSLANFPKIIDYPHTEESKRIAGSLGASINIFIDIHRSNKNWSVDFWKRGFELEHCYWEE